jgi:mannose-6-phosphate isomerase-like protein (cupin superfamily)
MQVVESVAVGYTVLRPEEQQFGVPSWRPDVTDRPMLEVSRHAPLEHSRASLWRYPPGARGRRHRQLVQEEIFVILEGEFTMLLGEPPERVTLPPRSIVVVEPLTPLQLLNETDGEGVIFIYGAPADPSSERLD